MTAIAECVCAQDPLWLDVLWSMFGFILGLVTGLVVRGWKR